MDDDYTLNELVASEIRGWLGKRQMSGRQLAAKIGASQTWMSTRLRGTTEIGINELGRIAEALEVEVADLLPQPALRDERPGGRTNGGYAAQGHQVHPRLPDQPLTPQPHHLPLPHVPEPHLPHRRHATGGRARPSWTHEGATT